MTLCYKKVKILEAKLLARQEVGGGWVYFRVEVSSDHCPKARFPLRTPFQVAPPGLPERPRSGIEPGSPLQQSSALPSHQS